jgi:hypothetical protein
MTNESACNCFHPTWNCFMAAKMSQIAPWVQCVFVVMVTM